MRIQSGCFRVKLTQTCWNFVSFGQNKKSAECWVLSWVIIFCSCLNHCLQVSNSGKFTVRKKCLILLLLSSEQDDPHAVWLFSSYSCLYSLTMFILSHNWSYLIIDLISLMLIFEPYFWPLNLTMSLHVVLTLTMAVLIVVHVELPNLLSFLKPVLFAVLTLVICCPPPLSDLV